MRQDAELQKVLFTDLDGTLIETRSGRTFPLHSEDWRFIGATLDVIKEVYGKGYKIIIVSNQGGIAEGYLTERVFIHKIEAIVKRLEEELELQPNSVSYYFHPKMSGYNRKPNPGMAVDALADYELTLKGSVMLGDMESDKEFTINAGIRHFVHIDEIRAGHARKV